MWLINANTLELEEHDGPNIDLVRTYFEADEQPDILSSGDRNNTNFSTVPYAILSHRWQDDEVTMEDFRNPAVRQQKRGFAKIERCCQEALRSGLKYVWVDTCCINKTSQLEVAESINSMYVWYQAATVCYAYLCDVDTIMDMQNSVWFRRGWTLQELIAPLKLKFFNRHWLLLNHRHAMAPWLCDITGIDEALLRGQKRVNSFSVAQRMCWAQGRETKRAEDRAYCLIGLFEVNLSLQYGEGGQRAFKRLQEEIIKQMYDHTVFAWAMSESSRNHSLLASSPDDYPKDLTLVHQTSSTGEKVITVSGAGIALALRIAPFDTDTYLALLECVRVSKSTTDRDSLVAIFLRKLRSERNDRWIRVSHNGRSLLYGEELIPFTHGSKRLDFNELQLNVRQINLSQVEKKQLQSRRGFGFKLTNSVLGLDRKHDSRMRLVRGPGALWNDSECLLYKNAGSTVSPYFGLLDLTNMKLKIKCMKLFIDQDFCPIVFMAQGSALDEKSINSRYDYIPPVEQVEGARAFHSRTIEDKYGWNVIEKHASGKDLAKTNNRVREGLWMLRGDRVAGIHVVLEHLVPDRDHPAELKVTIEPGDDDKPRYWVVELINILPKQSAFGKVFS